MAWLDNSNREMMSEINVTPLVDVMLVLLVVFIVTAPLLTQAVAVKLPGTVATGISAPGKQKTVSIDARGVVRLDDVMVDDKALAQALAGLSGSKADVELHVHADAAVPYGRVAQVMAIAQRAGISKLSFMSIAEH